MTDLNKERELYMAAKARIEKEEFFCRDWDLWKACAELKQAEINELRAELEKAKAQAVPEWISVEDKLPEIADASVLAHFQNGSIETVHIEDWFKDITSGFDEAGNQTFTKWYLKTSNTITHWMPLPEAPIETGA
ncbi:DUF551 domain-containing protein [Acinetobacter baumannii]|uniref:DUF551 domain-containing protein n=1 Tax=Acinetobacter baumannii TaxID=470 RepID=UPI00112EB403|nr:DUF551 domain-containing protein [Acinetobacter baumannii]TPR80627.1 DUF551 domain-containing protein [Acinetobacter baumannii]